MFSGIIEEVAEVRRIQAGQGASRLEVRSALDHSATKIGDSVAIEGACLTVVARRAECLSFDVVEETLKKTTIGTLMPGNRVNLERALKFGERVHGHLVSGHVDTTVALLKLSVNGAACEYTWELPKILAPFMACKGSIAIAGVSLTVGEVHDESFKVYLVPHTVASTSLRGVREGTRVNLEVDMLARYVQSSLQRRGL